MDDRRIRPQVWFAVLGALALLAVLVAVLESRRARPVPEPEPEVAAAIPSAHESPGSPSSRREARLASPASGVAEDPVPYIDGLVYGEIDLREARELMPNNLYWKYGAPTKDPAVLAERDAEKKRRNDEYGRVLAGDASEDDVRAYYDYRKKLAADYFEFAEFMHRRYQDSKNEEFVGMLDLAMKLNAAKLQQIPDELEAALQRARDHEKAREEWRRQKEEFGGEPPPAGSDR
jgi:hypothetical protein